MNEKRRRRETSPGKEKKRRRVCFVGGLDIELWEIVFTFLPRGYWVPFGMTCRAWYDMVCRAMAAEDWVDLILGSPWSEGDDDPHKLGDALQDCIGELPPCFEHRAKRRILDYIAARYQENDGEWRMDDVKGWYDDWDDGYMIRPLGRSSPDKASGYCSTHGYRVPFIEPLLAKFPDQIMMYKFNWMRAPIWQHLKGHCFVAERFVGTGSYIPPLERCPPFRILDNIENVGEGMRMASYAAHITAKTKDDISATLDAYFSKAIGQILYQHQFLPEKHAIRHIRMYWGVSSNVSRGKAARYFVVHTTLDIARVCHEREDEEKQ